MSPLASRHHFRCWRLVYVDRVYLLLFLSASCCLCQRLVVGVGISSSFLYFSRCRRCPSSWLLYSDFSPCHHSCRQPFVVVVGDVLYLSATVSLLLDYFSGFGTSSSLSSPLSRHRCLSLPVVGGVYFLLSSSASRCRHRLLVVVVGILLLSTASRCRCCFVVFRSGFPYCGYFRKLIHLVVVIIVVGSLIVGGVYLFFSSPASCRRHWRCLVVVVSSVVTEFSENLSLY